MISSHATDSSAVVLSSLETFVATTSQDSAYRQVLDNVYLLIPLGLVFVLMFWFLKRP